MRRIHLSDPRSAMREAGLWILPASLAAGIAGLIVGGIGGRLAMLLLRLTSGDHVVGVESDDGFIIGRFSGDTLFLVFGASLLSVTIFGPLLATTRLWIPAGIRTATFCALLAVAGGAAVVHSDGVDFTMLSPRWLAIGLFVALPATFGLVLEPLHQWLRPRTERLPAPVLMAAPVIATVPLILLGPPVILALPLWAMLLFGQAATVRRVARARVTAWVGRLALAMLGTVSALDLARDVNALLL